MKTSWTSDRRCRACGSWNGWEFNGKYRQIAIRSRSRKHRCAAVTSYARGARAFGKVVGIDIAARTVDIKKTRKSARFILTVRIRQGEGRQRRLGGCPVPDRRWVDATGSTSRDRTGQGGTCCCAAPAVSRMDDTLVLPMNARGRRETAWHDAGPFRSPDSGTARLRQDL